MVIFRAGDRKVRTAFEVSGSNPSLRKYAYFVKKNYTLIVDGFVAVAG